MIEELVDHRFGAREGSGVRNDGAQSLDAGVVEAGIAEQGTQMAALRIIGPLMRESDEHRALTFAQIISCGFAGLLWVAEDPENVVPQLEGFTEGQSVSGVGGGDLLRCARDSRTDVQRAFDRLLR